MSNEPIVTTESFTRIDNDTNGNPRFYVPVFLFAGIPEKKIKAVGLYKYRGKCYGKGYTIVSYNLAGTVDFINRELITR